MLAKIVISNREIIAKVVLVFSLLIISYLAFTPQEEKQGLGFDKLNHIFAFTFLAFISHQAFLHQSLIKLTILPLIIYGLFIESVQFFLPYRTFSLYDIMADIFGLLVYYLALLVFNKSS